MTYISVYGQIDTDNIRNKHHLIRYYNLLTSERLYAYLFEIKKQAENMFQRLVKSLAEQEYVTEKMKAEKPY